MYNTEDKSIFLLDIVIVSPSGCGQIFTFAGRHFIYVTKSRIKFMNEIF